MHTSISTLRGDVFKKIEYDSSNLKGIEEWAIMT